MHRSWRVESSLDGPDGPDEPLFRVEVTPERDVVRVSPVGELDMATAGALGTELRELRDSGFTRVVLDLRDTTFLDSTGLRTILDEYAFAKADGAQFAIVPGPPAVQRVFDVTCLHDRLPFVGADAEDHARGRS